MFQSKPWRPTATQLIHWLWQVSLVVGTQNTAFSKRTNNYG